MLICRNAEGVRV